MTLRTGNASGSTDTMGRGFLAWPASRLLARLPHRCAAGSLSITLPSGNVFTCCSDQPGPHAHIELKRWRGLARIAFGGNVGFARAYMDADCDCTDLERLFEWVLVNDDVSARIGCGGLVLRWHGRRHHRRNANTLTGSRRNIASHYDLGNEFYAAWLDAGMSYSSALYRGDDRLTLEQAQDAKLDLVVDLLELDGSQRVLEIGCGWGGLAERLAAGPAAHVSAITLSQHQHDLANRRLATPRAEGRVAVRLQDYRQLDGSFDRIVSIEMLEAVGERYWPVYFETLERCLKPGGVAVVQVITIRDDRFAAYRREPDFIQRYIFPGGMLPTRAILHDEGKRAGLELVHTETFGQCYARTLVEWRARFQTAWPRLAEMGFDERFRRMWTYYLAYCEAGFRAGELDVGLYRFVKPM